MPRNLFTGDGDEPGEVPQEDLGGLFEDVKELPVTHKTLEEIKTEHVANGTWTPTMELMYRNLGGTADDEDRKLLQELVDDDEKWFDSLRRRSLEGRPNPSRFERG